MNVGALVPTDEVVSCVFEYIRSSVVMGHQGIEVAIVVKVTEVGCPGLGSELELPVVCAIQNIATRGVLEVELVKSQGARGVVFAGEAFGDVEVEAMIAVDIGEGYSVVAGSVEKLLRGAQKRSFFAEGCRTVLKEKSVSCDIVGDEEVEPSVVVVVGHGNGLRIGVVGRDAYTLVVRICGVEEELVGIVVVAQEDILSVVGVKICNRQGIKRWMGHRKDGAFDEALAVSHLIKHVERASLVAYDDVVQQVAIDIANADV